MSDVTTSASTSSAFNPFCRSLSYPSLTATPSASAGGFVKEPRSSNDGMVNRKAIANAVTIIAVPPPRRRVTFTAIARMEVRGARGEVHLLCVNCCSVCQLAYRRLVPQHTTGDQATKPWPNPTNSTPSAPNTGSATTL